MAVHNTLTLISHHATSKRNIRTLNKEEKQIILHPKLEQPQKPKEHGKIIMSKNYTIAAGDLVHSSHMLSIDPSPFKGQSGCDGGYICV